MAMPLRSFASDTAGSASGSAGARRGRRGSETISSPTMTCAAAETAKTSRARARSARRIAEIRRALQQRWVLSRIVLVHQLVHRGADRLAVRLRPVIAVGAVRRAVLFPRHRARLGVEPLVGAV